MAHRQQQFQPGQESMEWQNSLLDCGPCDNCMVGTFLPCILLGRTSQRVRDPSMQTYEAINSDCLVMCGISLFIGCGWIYAMMKRSEIRERYGIEGSGCSDCCSSYWCTCCALIQQEKEVQARTGHTAVVQQQYLPPRDGMQMPK